MNNPPHKKNDRNPSHEQSASSKRNAARHPFRKRFQWQKANDAPTNETHHQRLCVARFMATAMLDDRLCA